MGDEARYVLENGMMRAFRFFMKKSTANPRCALFCVSLKYGQLFIYLIPISFNPLAMKIQSLFSFLFLGTLVGCTADQVGGDVCFESEILPIFNANCTMSGCHNSTTQTEGLDASSYAGIKAFLDDEGKRDLLGPLQDDGDDRMPPAPYPALTSDQIDLIARWLRQGAENTTNCDTATVCDTVAVSFAQDVQPIFNANCINCHSGAAASGGYDFTGHAGAAGATGVLEGALRHELGFQPMPSSSVMLSDCQINTIVSWINAGALNN